MARAMDASPTCHPTGPTGPVGVAPPGFRRQRFRRTVGHGPGVFDAARRGLSRWTAHRGSGVEVFPSGAGVADGETVVLLTRQLGVWVLMACRIESTIDEADHFGFTYAALPGHPERGSESFEVRRLASGEIRFEIVAVSRPDLALVRLLGPVARLLQRRATRGYLKALAAAVAG